MGRESGISDLLIIREVNANGKVKGPMSEIMEEMEEIRKEIRAISHKLDIPMEERELYGIMGISDRSLSSFLIGELDTYTINDCKVVYR